MFSFKKRRVKTPTLLQMEVTECGAAALAIILSYYGKHIPLEQMRIDCGVSRDGCSATNILQAARQHGLTAKAVKVDEPDELRELNFPFIVFWNFNHFLVVEGIKNERFYINDPASGMRIVSYEEFNLAFTGVALILSPDSNFKKSGKKVSLWNSLKIRLKGSIHDLVFIFLASIALVIPNIAIPGFSKIFIDNIIIENMRNWILPFFAAFSITAIVLGILLWFQQYYLLRLRVKLVLATTVSFICHIISLPMSFFSQRYVGDISERVSANDRIAVILSNQLSTALISVISMVIYIIPLLILSWQLTVISLIATSFNIIIFYLVARRYADTGRDFLQQNGKLLGVEMSSIRQVEDLKASGRKNVFFNYWSGVHARVISLQQKLAYYNMILKIIPTWSVMVSTAIILAYGSLQVIRGELTIGSIVAFQMLLNSFNTPIYTLLSFGEDLQKIKGDLARLDDIYDYQPDPRLTIVPKMKDLQPKVLLQDISFSYSPFAPLLLENINLQIEPGKRIAIIGKTGEGKSTLAKLICGLYQPLSGKIFIDDEPLTDISNENLATILSFVEQDIFLYSGTVRENISLWNSTISKENIQQALMDACIYDVIDKRGGIDCEVVEAGQNFSAGQRQRLEIARALATNPKILIIDEATSNIDAKTEANILENIKKRGCTTIMITHHLRAVRGFDYVYKLEHRNLNLMSEGLEHG